MKEKCEKEAVTIDQPDRFDLELELVRWVKVKKKLRSRPLHLTEKTGVLKRILLGSR